MSLSIYAVPDSDSAQQRNNRHKPIYHHHSQTRLCVFLSRHAPLASAAFILSCNITLKQGGEATDRAGVAVASNDRCSATVAPLVIYLVRFRAVCVTSQNVRGSTFASLSGLLRAICSSCRSFYKEGLITGCSDSVGASSFRNYLPAACSHACASCACSGLSEWIVRVRGHSSLITNPLKNAAAASSGFAPFLNTPLESVSDHKHLPDNHIAAASAAITSSLRPSTHRVTAKDATRSKAQRTAFPVRRLT